MKKPVGYENPVIPGKPTQRDVGRVEQVYAFLPGEKRIQKQVERLNEIIQKGLTAEERLADVRRSCSHRVFIDRPGVPYDTRTCCVCGAGLGVV